MNLCGQKCLSAPPSPKSRERKPVRWLRAICFVKNKIIERQGCITCVVVYIIRTRPDTRPISVADGCAGVEMRVFTLFDSCSQTNGRTDWRTDKQSLLLSCVSATKNSKRTRNMSSYWNLSSKNRLFSMLEWVWYTLFNCCMLVFYRCLCKNTQMYTRTQLRQSGNDEKSDENQATQSIEIAKNPLNFEFAEGGYNMFVSASFTHIW